MDFIISASTDVGLQKETNQDSVTVKVAQTSIGKVCMAVLCDGMGGLSKGELASAELVVAFSDWFATRLPMLIQEGIEDGVLRAEWTELILSMNKKIQSYGHRYGIQLGTTVTAALFTQNRYYIINVGDTRAYQIYDGITQLTEDQTFVQNEVRRGNLTPEEALNHPRRNILLQCVGASEVIFPDMYFGDVLPGMVFVLCCDGFRHELSEDEILSGFAPIHLADAETIKQCSEYLIDLNKARQETDNITVAVVKTV